MYHSLRKFIVATWIACTCITALPAAADPINYAIYQSLAGHFGLYANITGNITTDGTLGALTPENILIWNETKILRSSQFFLGEVNCDSSTCSPFTWSPGSVTATPTEINFDFGPNFTASASFGTFGFQPSSGCSTCFPQITGGISQQFALSEFYTIAVVPAPIAGADLPGVLLAMLIIFGGFYWKRRTALARFPHPS